LLFGIAYNLTATIDFNWLDKNGDYRTWFSEVAFMNISVRSVDVALAYNFPATL